METRPTLQAIAERSGVTRMTVSLALRNHPRIPEATRRKIQEVARLLGYSPDPLMSDMMARRRLRQPYQGVSTIAFVTAHSTRDGWRKRGRIHLDYFEGAQERAQQRGYRLEEFWAREPGMSSRRFSSVLITRGIHGILLAALPASRGHLSLDWSKFAVATLGYSVWKPSFHRATQNHFQFTWMAFRKLTRLGYRRIGLVIPSPVNERANHQYTAALLDFHQRVSKANRIPALLFESLDERLFRSWLERTKPDVVVGGEFRMVEWMRKHGRRIPQDVGFVHLGRSEAPSDCAAIDHHGRVIGAAAIDLIVEQLQRHEYGIPAHPKVVLIEADWSDGSTVRSQSS